MPSIRNDAPSHSGKDPLVAALRRVQIRLGVQRWVGHTVKALFISASAGCLWVILSRLFPQLGDPMYPVIGLLAAGYLAALVSAIVGRPSLLDAALAADRRLGLRERLTTSLELSAVHDSMVDAVHADARCHVDGLNAARQFPLVNTRAGRWVYVPLLLLGLAYILFPEFDLLQHREREADAKTHERAVAVKVERIRSAVKPLKEKAGDAPAALNEITTAIDALAADLESAAITDKQAMARLSNLSEELRKHREGLARENPTPKLAGDLNKLGITRELASALQQGRMSEAAEKARELANKLSEGTLTEQEAKKLRKELKTLADMLGGSKSEIGAALAEALAKAGSAVDAGDMTAAAEAMAAVELSLEDLASMLDQLGKMDTMMANLAEWKRDFMGPSAYCRTCGMKMGEGSQCNADGSGECCGSGMKGMCGSCAGMGLGLRGPGRGVGNELGELPDVDVDLKPTMAGGPLTKGKMLADILQRTAPEIGDEPTVEYISGAFVELKQAAEQALTQEEIPQGSKEFVRQYFGSLEPETP